MDNLFSYSSPSKVRHCLPLCVVMVNLGDLLANNALEITSEESYSFVGVENHEVLDFFYTLTLMSLSRMCLTVILCRGWILLEMKVIR